jgi:hypothetical protein
MVGLKLVTLQLGAEHRTSAPSQLDWSTRTVEHVLLCLFTVTAATIIQAEMVVLCEFDVVWPKVVKYDNNSRTHSINIQWNFVNKNLKINQKLFYVWDKSNVELFYSKNLHKFGQIYSYLEIFVLNKNIIR